MEIKTLMTLTIIGTVALYGLTNLLFLNTNGIRNRNLEKYTLYTILGFFFISSSSILFISGGPGIVDLLYLLLIAVLVNPLFILFPLTQIADRLSPSVRVLLSKVFLIIYSVILLFGLLGMTSPGNTWGNSALYQGFMLIMWALPNILLSTMMSYHMRFTGIIKILTGMVAIVIMALTLKETEYTGDFEHSFRILAFIIAAYLAFEGYLFLGKGKETS